MAQNKEGTEKKPGVKIQDLSPKKDAKGGAIRMQQGADQNKGFVDPNKGGPVDPNKGIVNPNASAGVNEN